MDTIETYKAVFNSAPDGLIVANDLGEIILINNQVEKIFGYTKSELIGQKIELLIPKRFHEKHSTQRSDYSKKPSAREMGAKKELWAIRKNGTEFSVEISLSPIHLKNRTLISAAIRDVSDKKKVELEIEKQNKRLLQQNKELEQFTYLTSHDLQEPLQSLINFSSLLKSEYEKEVGEVGNQYIDFISKSSSRLQELVKGLMYYSLIGKEQEMKPVDYNEIINEVIFELNPIIKKHQIKIIKQELPTIASYSNEIKQLLKNLIDNAIKFRKKGCLLEINITATKENDAWIISINDNGIGIEDQNKNTIFTIFKRLHNRNEYDGIGIGLAHCKKIIDLHGGEIWVDSKLGEGSRFSFSIPKF